MISHGGTEDTKGVGTPTKQHFNKTPCPPCLRVKNTNLSPFVVYRRSISLLFALCSLNCELATMQSALRWPPSALQATQGENQGRGVRDEGRGFLFPRPQSLSLFPYPYSLFPYSYSLFPYPYSLFPYPYSLFPHSRYKKPQLKFRACRFFSCVRKFFWTFSFYDLSRFKRGSGKPEMFS